MRHPLHEALDFLAVTGSIKLIQLSGALMETEEARAKRHDEIAKLAMADTKDRLKAQLDLVYAIDRQAMSFFGICVTSASAIAIAAGALIRPWLMRETSSAGPALSASYIVLSVGLCLAAAGFLASAAMCLDAMKKRRVHLPGRDSSFWIWATAKERTLSAIAEGYVGRVAEDCEAMRLASNSMAKRLEEARRLSLATAIAGLMIVGLAVLARG